MGVLSKIDDVLTSRWVLRLISVVVAIAMWFYVTGMGDAPLQRRKFPIRFEYLNMNPQFFIRGERRQNVEVEVEAPENVLDKLNQNALWSAVDLTGYSVGMFQLRVRVDAPADVTVVGTIPSLVSVELAQHMSRVFQVEVVLPQDLPVGRYLEAVEIVPREIVVKGPEKDLAKIGSLSIAPTAADLESGKELHLSVKVSQSDPFEFGKEVDWEPKTVRMNAALVRGLPRKKAPVNVRLSGKPASDFAVRSVLTDPAEVMVQGPKAKLDAVSAVDTETVDITNLARDETLVVPLRAFRDKALSMVDVNSVKISVRLEPIMAQRVVSNVPVVVEGATAGIPPGKKWTITPAVVDVVLEAPPSKMEAFDPEKLNLRVFLNTSNFFLVKGELPVQATVSGDFRVVQVKPSTLSVTQSTGAAP
ncbi:MAG: hypothetical protein LBD04_11155 [Synergistaceae bacterium]|jgi:YbbR domain-containing protein|nr:hypothetical protein [Synergistaceae bacterium]